MKESILFLNNQEIKDLGGEDMQAVLHDCQRAYVLMEEAGLTVRLDNSGALIGRLEGETPATIMIGSHFDSVGHGGAYDGIAGVVCGNCCFDHVLYLYRSHPPGCVRANTNALPRLSKYVMVVCAPA